ncbi:glycosyltransferase family 4 protein [Cerasicoccus fimbriatus]|uniref:glycosyltransferase family 4 protein n=1 Tax=Cerasicoccus fimbriatus TaxID=3014554 RepID=UPI0022B537CB|nr:glycosyltransferase family 4 protein [Cerasicoccus sp. TK19100]
MSDKRLLVIIGCFPFPRGEAASVRVCNFAHAVRESGWDVEVMTYGASGSQENYEIDGVRYVSLFPANGGRLASQLSYYWVPFLLARKIKRRYLGQKNIAVMIYNGVATVNFPIFLAFKSLGAFVLADINESPSSFTGRGGKLSPNYWNFWFSYHWVARKFDLIAGITHSICDYFTRCGLNSVVYPSIGNFASLCNHHDANDPIQLLYMGRFFDRDRPDWMFALLGYLKRSGVLFKLHCVGSETGNAYESKCVEEAFTNYPDLRDNVYFYGRVSECELLNIKRKAIAGFVLRRDHESERTSFPTRLVEMLELGIAVITSPVPDVNSYLTHGKDSIILGMKSLDDDAAMLKRFFEYPDKLADLGKAGWQTGKLHFSARSCAQRVLDEIVL